MAAHRQGPNFSWLRTWQELTGFRSADKPHSDKRQSRLHIETLETRALLASDLAAISGLVYLDVTGNGYEVGEELSGAMVQLYRDNGDGMFNPASDMLVNAKTTGPAGKYRFDNVTAGNYFVQQQSLVVGKATLPAVTSQLMTITPSDANGQMYTVIDSFNTTQQIAKANSSKHYATSTALASEALGGYRKFVVSLDQNIGTMVLTANDPDSGLSRLDYSATATASGSRRVTWDGTGSAADVTNFVGLGGIDLTKGGQNTGIATVIGADKVGVITMRLYTDANNYSTATIQIPNTGGAATTQVYVPFSSFMATAGTGATLTSIGAIQLDVSADSTATDGQIDAIGAVGPTVKTVNFENLTIDLALSKTVDNSSPQVNGQVTFAVTVNNVGAIDATGVQVQDWLPAGLNYVLSSATQGSYNAATGIWNVGNVAKGGLQTLTIVATVLSPGTKINTAQVWAAAQVDIDSVPGNNNPSEDDQASVVVTPKVIDLSLTKTVDLSTPYVNQMVTFAITVRNDGPSNATGVTVLDVLPPGLTYKSSTASLGSYNGATGLWTVGSLANGQSETLTITAKVTTSGTKTNTAEVATANEYDVDSTPGNNNPLEDDRANAVVEPIAPLPAPPPARFSKLRFLAR